jgi:hypothetical protein
MTIKLPQTILDAIEAGEKINNARLDKIDVLNRTKYEQEKKAKIAYAEYCRKWVINKLPEIIKKNSAKGIFWEYISEEQALACEEIGLRISKMWHHSARDPDGGPGNYEGWEYKVHWK